MASSKKNPGNGGGSGGRFERPSSVRLWLMYPPGLIQLPVLWELGHKFSLVTNIRQASVTDAIGIVCIELEGAPAEIESGIAWMRTLGVKVEPVELNAME